MDLLMTVLKYINDTYTSPALGCCTIFRQKHLYHILIGTITFTHLRAVRTVDCAVDVGGVPSKFSQHLARLQAMHTY